MPITIPNWYRNATIIYTKTVFEYETILEYPWNMNMIKDLREVLGMSQQQLAEAAGTSQPQIKRLESGERKLTKEWAERISAHLNVTPEILMFGWPEDDPTVTPAYPSNSDDPFELPNAKIGDKIVGHGRKIPVYGQAVGGVDGEFLMNGTVLFEVMAPPVISHISDAYAVAVSGESMAPRYEDGEVCFIDPRRRVRKGDYVVAQIRVNEHSIPHAYVKKFVRHNSIELVLEQFNPPKELRFPASSVVSVHFIALAGIA
ncbi:helix-turn-helix transcriptional regulator [Ensifer sp. PDNC004]|uniref:XRE family transcriptional regulator n=1 Tax=Ensifer sp. PDNC004 TaxID=2811423 RepID=UPI00196345FE|nr:helix-turn-helix transcriptional regulator [Ensifer sp. PDNC004]QRY69201.1 helix-turn-helix transcriptional regulator [Ensifer sp. PDNC004]